MKYLKIYNTESDFQNDIENLPSIFLCIAESENKYHFGRCIINKKLPETNDIILSGSNYILMDSKEKILSI